MLSLPVTKFVTKIAWLGYAVKFIATEAHSNSLLGAGQLISRLDAPTTSPCCLDVIQKNIGVPGNRDCRERRGQARGFF